MQFSLPPVSINWIVAITPTKSYPQPAVINTINLSPFGDPNAVTPTPTTVYLPPTTLVTSTTTSASSASSPTSPPSLITRDSLTPYGYFSIEELHENFRVSGQLTLTGATAYITLVDSGSKVQGSCSANMSMPSTASCTPSTWNWALDVNNTRIQANHTVSYKNGTTVIRSAILDDGSPGDLTITQNLLSSQTQPNCTQDVNGQSCDVEVIKKGRGFIEYKVNVYPAPTGWKGDAGIE